MGRQPKNKGVKNELNKVAAHQTIDCEYYDFVPRLVQLLTDENFHTLQINLDFFPTTPAPVPGPRTNHGKQHTRPTAVPTLVLVSTRPLPILTGFDTLLSLMLVLLIPMALLLVLY